MPYSVDNSNLDVVTGLYTNSYNLNLGGTSMKYLISILTALLCSNSSASVHYDEPIGPQIPHEQYTINGRYCDGIVTDCDGNSWAYSADIEVYDNMPVFMVMDDNCTKCDITDDIVLGIVYDRATALVDSLEINLTEADFDLSRDGNTITIH